MKRNTNKYYEENYTGLCFQIDAELAVKKKNYSKALNIYREEILQLQDSWDGLFQNGYQLVEFDAVISKGLANVLRLQGKHLEALVELTYFISVFRRSSWVNPNEAQEEKLKAYLRRAKLHNIGINELNDYLDSFDDDAPQDARRGVDCYQRIQQQIYLWSDRVLNRTPKLWIGKDLPKLAAERWR